jgi:hypothetical protein
VPGNSLRTGATGKDAGKHPIGRIDSRWWLGMMKPATD